MNNIATIATPSPLLAYSAEQLKLIKRTVAKDCNADEFDLFIEICRHTMLDPFRKQIHCTIYNKDKPEKRQMVIITAVDGLRAVAARNGDYRPDDNEPTITFDESLKDPDRNPRGIEKAVVRAYKKDPDGGWNGVDGVAYWNEFAPIEEEVEWVATGETWEDSGKPKKKPKPTGKYSLDPKNPNSFWRRMPNLMLAKCAEAQALRKGWPEDLSGIYAPEELDSADAIDVSATEVVEQAEEQRRLTHVKAVNSILIQWTAGEEIKPVPLGELADRCFEFISKSESATQLETWWGMNVNAMKEFWAREKSDCLAVRQAYEKRIAELDRPIDQPEGETEKDESAT